MKHALEVVRSEGAAVRDRYRRHEEELNRRVRSGREEVKRLEGVVGRLESANLESMKKIEELSVEVRSKSER